VITQTALAILASAIPITLVNAVEGQKKMKYSGTGVAKTKGNRKLPHGNTGNKNFPTVTAHGNRYYKGDIMGNSKG
jgi:hypothetical protein